MVPALTLAGQSGAVRRRQCETDPEEDGQAVAGRAVPADPVMVLRPVVVGPAEALAPETDLDLVAQAQAQECLVPDPLYSGHPCASSVDSRSSSGAVACSTMVPASTSNRPEQVTQTPDVPLSRDSSVPSRGGWPEPRHRPTSRMVTSGCMNVRRSPQTLHRLSGAPTKRVRAPAGAPVRDLGRSAGRG
jgi:hypothetical protein